MNGRTASVSTMEDARNIARDPHYDDCIKIYGAYHSIHPLKPRCQFVHQSPSLIIRRFLPCIAWIQNYQWIFLEYDIIAGLTVGLTVIPQSLAYASIAELPVQVQYSLLILYIFIHFQYYKK